MSIKQLTVFVQNKKGTVVAVTDILSKNNINIRALSIAETQDFGILRLIVNEEEAAVKALTEAGYLLKVTEVVGVKIGDAPGKLSAVLRVLDDKNINVEYMYAETYICNNDLNNKTLGEVNEYIRSVISAYPNHKLIPSFDIS